MKVGDLVKSWHTTIQQRGIVVAVPWPDTEKYLGANEYVKVQWSYGAIKEVGTWHLRTLSEVTNESR
jgi:hypothetical protein|tara:strand:- start:33 stop:233 length:201 start_codon:yes stop_codon:yes gene_type:complete